MMNAGDPVEPNATSCVASPAALSPSPSVLVSMRSRADRVAARDPLRSLAQHRVGELLDPVDALRRPATHEIPEPSRAPSIDGAPDVVNLVLERQRTRAQYL